MIRLTKTKESLMNRVNRAHAYILIVMIGQLLISLAIGLTGYQPKLVASALITQYGLILIPAILYFIITKSNIKETLHFKKVSAANIWLAIALAFFIQPIMTFVNLISQLFVTNYIADYLPEMMSLPFWLLLFIMAVTPAITEEITFRGIVLSNYKHQTVLAACIMNGLLFGIFHGNLNQMAYAFFLGAIFCYVTHLTKSIIPAMIMHFVINASQVSLQKLLTIMSDYLFSSDLFSEELANATATTSTGDIVAAIIGVAFLLIIFVPLSWLVLRQMHRHNKIGNMIKNKSISGIMLGDLDEETIIKEGDEIVSESSVGREKILSPILIMLIVYFILYSALFEFILPAIQA